MIKITFKLLLDLVSIMIYKDLSNKNPTRQPITVYIIYKEYIMFNPPDFYLKKMFLTNYHLVSVT